MATAGNRIAYKHLQLYVAKINRSEDVLPLGFLRSPAYYRCGRSLMGNG